LLPNKKYILFGSIPNFARMADSQLELILMHIKAIKAGYDSNCPWILILEDDARISEKVKVDIELICKMYQKEKTILINLNSGANMHHTRSDPKPNQFGIYRVRPIGVRCTTSYLINRETAKKLLNLFNHYKPQDWLPIDVQIQIAVQKLKGKTYWQDPPIFIQGSEDGTYLSNLR
jgi:GR25 family glycosyltransferase involved in LPS biosynthesis